jgi:hypothetical protein
MNCNKDCNGHGYCVSLRDAGTLKDDVNFFSTVAYSTMWDAERIFGCVCDAGYTGYDCSATICPFGDDPMTISQVDETQIIDCSATAGSFTVRFRGQLTAPIQWNAIAQTSAESGSALGSGVGESLESKLKALTGIRGITATFLNSATQMCSTSGQATRVTFTHNPGDVPDMIIDSSSVTAATVAVRVAGAASSISVSHTSQTGTKENVECSGRGLCLNGICECFAGYGSSDGTGAAQGRESHYVSCLSSFALSHRKPS